MRKLRSDTISSTHPGFARRGRRVLGVALAIAIGMTTAAVAAGTASAGAASAGSARAARHITGLRPRSSASPLYSVDYALVGDVGGESVAKGDTVTLTFAGGGTVYLLATSAGGDLAFVGAWSYKAPVLTLSFNTSGFDRKASFKLNLSATQILIPFHVFDSKKGNSLWKRGSIDPIDGAYAVADATAANTAQGLPISTIIAAAAAYVAGVSGVGVSGGTASVAHLAARGLTAKERAGTGELRLPLGHFGVRSGASLGRAAALTARAQWRAAPAATPDLITAVKATASGLLVTFNLKTQLNVVIDSADQPTTSPLPLTPAPLALDPRVHLSAKPPGISSGDPAVKKALFIDPFLNTRYNGWNAYGDYYLPSVVALSSSAPINVEKSKLAADGYAVAQLATDNATVSNIIGALKANPGVLMIETHGAANGMIATGSYLGNTAQDALYELHKLDASLLAQFGMPAGALLAGSVPSVSGTQYFANLTPAFWTWMESSKGLNLSRSLVYMGACYTDRSPAFRDAIKARAYFAFQQEAFSPLVSAVGNYLIRLLYRPTVTAEEAYYNMIRVDQSAQEIYVEDAAFNGALYPQARLYNGMGVKSAILGVLDAYFYNGKTTVSYVPNGWLSASLNHGEVWWLVFASRWGQNVVNGVANLKACWNDYWSKKKLGGIASPFCNGANDGVLPTKDEVFYAIYLVTGETGFSSNITAVARFTLNDGR